MPVLPLLAYQSTTSEGQSLSSTMSAFSFTAPFWSSDDEAAEIDGLTPQEQRDLYDDLHGRLEVVHEPPEALARGIAMVQSAIDCMEPAEKADYLEALRVAPEVVEHESSMAAFWRCTSGDAWAAARRLVEYWTVRKETFGSRAFLPCRMGSLLDKEDVQTLHKGIIHILPDDVSGRPVLFWDRIRSVDTVASRDSIVRCLFYMMQVMSERIDTQRSGYVWMVYLRVSSPVRFCCCCCCCCFCCCL
jgi:hypothetical protein